MDNLTHSLLGGVLAEIGLPASAARGTRRVFFAVGIVASNLPDVDLLYTRITAPPLGYLLHHRGHTHTVVGLVVQAVLLAALCLLVPAIRRLDPGARRRLAMLGAVALGSHLVLDSWNSYGVHPFHPLDSRWYYGDAVFIFEPWLWMLLGVAVATSAAHRASRILVTAAVTLIPLAFAVLGVLSVLSIVLLAAGAAAFAWACRLMTPARRASAALACAAAFVTLLFGLRVVARSQVRSLIATQVRGHVLDIVLSPLPAEPYCWSAIVVEEYETSFALHRGTLSLLPSLVPPERCALHRLWGLPSIAWPGQARMALAPAIEQSVDTWRHYARDCRVQAWMQFARAPFLRGEKVRDLRYESGPRENFTAMRVLDGGPCPTHVTSWGMPRADLLRASP